MTRVLVTGASGFIGRQVCLHLTAAGFEVLRAARHRPATAPAGEAWFEFGADIGRVTPAMFDQAVAGSTAIIHLAGRAHVLREKAVDPLAEFRRANLDFTTRLAEAALRNGVRRFVLVSSIGVLGEWSDRPLLASDEPRPESAYARSKLQAEQALRAVCTGSATEWVIVRPPLVSGPGCPGNLARLAGLVARRVPLPLGGFANRRSLIGVANLADLLVACVTVPAAANAVFLCADDGEVSSADIARLLGEGMGVKALIVPVPVRWLTLAARWAGKGDIERFVRDLRVDCSATRLALGWSPALPLREGLLATGRAWRKP